MTSPPSSRFAVNLDAEDNERFDRVVRDVGRVTGPLPSHRGRRGPSRADLMRAMLVVVESNPSFAAEVRSQVVVEVLGPRADEEVHAVADELRRGASWLGTPDAQDSASLIVEQLETLSLDDVERASEALRGQAERIAWLAAQVGGYEGLRPLLDLARRLRLVRDAIDPVDTNVCLYCNQDVRVSGRVRLERHNDQSGSICPGGQSS